MTPAEELEHLRLENREFRIMLRKHKAIGEAAESEVRDLRRRMDSASDLLRDIVKNDNQSCKRCLKVLAQIVLHVDPSLV